MTEKIILYHRTFLLCLSFTIVCLALSLLMFVRFQIYKIFQRNKKKKRYKNVEKEEVYEQTMRMSDVKTLDLYSHPKPRGDDSAAWL